MAKKPAKKPTPKVNLTSGKGGKITQRGANTIPRYGLPSSTRPLLSDPGLPGTVAPRLPGTVAPGLPGTKATPKQVAEYKVGKMVQKRAAEKQAKARAARIPNYGLPGTVAKPKTKPQLPDTTTSRAAKPIPKYGLPSSKRPLLSDPGLPGTVAKPKPKQKPQLPDTMGTRQLKKIPNYGLPSSGRPTGGGGGGGGMGASSLTRKPRP